MVGKGLIFAPLTLPEHGKCRLSYVLKASIGVGYGNYKNTAWADDESGKISNDSTAMVAIVGDKLFDTASIIGKVFEDHNGNGYQNSAEAKSLVIKAKIDADNYVTGSTQLLFDGQLSKLNDKKQPPITAGIKLDSLAGKFDQQAKGKSEATLRFNTRTDQPFTLSVKSKTGSQIILDRRGRYQKIAGGDLKKGLSNEDIYVTRNLYRQAGQFLWEIIIQNNGKSDVGIPGVRLITPEGFKIDTDSYGRFHVPDRWVLDNKGRNFVIKVDTDSLPTGMRVLSENPKVLRMTPNKLNKVNFSVGH